MILGWENGILVGATSGVTIGVTLGVITGTEPIMITAYAISGLIAGLLNRFGKIGVAIGFISGLDFQSRQDRERPSPSRTPVNN